MLRHHSSTALSESVSTQREKPLLSLYSDSRSDYNETVEKESTCPFRSEENKDLGLSKMKRSYTDLHLFLLHKVMDDQ